MSQDYEDAEELPTHEQNVRGKREDNVGGFVAACLSDATRQSTPATEAHLADKARQRSVSKLLRSRCPTASAATARRTETSMAQGSRYRTAARIR